MEALRETKTLEASEVIANIEAMQQAADAVRALENGVYRTEADVAGVIEAYEDSIEGVDDRTLTVNGLNVFPGSSTLH